MKRLNVVELRAALADTLNRAEYQGERFVIHRRGKNTAAIVPIEDLELLERLIAEAEDREDLEAVRAARTAPGERIPFEDFCRRKGLTHDEEPAPRAAKQGGKRAAKAAVHD